jgi:hypothetical protein
MATGDGKGINSGIERPRRIFVIGHPLRILVPSTHCQRSKSQEVLSCVSASGDGSRASSASHPIASAERQCVVGRCTSSYQWVSDYAIFSNSEVSWGKGLREGYI